MSKTIRIKRALLVGLAMVCLVGCALESPIVQNPDATVNLLRNRMDQVHIGQSEADVRGLLGNCSNIYRNVSALGESAYWQYTVAEIAVHCCTDKSIIAALVNDPESLRIPIAIQFNNGLVAGINKFYRP